MKPTFKQTEKPFQSTFSQLFKFICLISITLFFGVSVTQAQIYAKESGDWSSPATWSTDAVPTNSDDVVIDGEFTVSVTTSGNECKSLQLGLADKAGILEFIGTSSLTVSGAITLGDVTEIPGIILMSDDATLTCTKLIESVEGLSSDFTFMNTGTLVFTGVNTMPPSFNQFKNLVIESGTTTLSSNIVINGNLTLNNSATLDLLNYTANRYGIGNNSSEYGTLIIENGAILKIGGGGTLCANFYYHSIGATSTVHYIGTSQSVTTLQSLQSYGNLIIGGTGLKLLTGSIGVNGDLTINAATLDMDVNTLSCGGSSKTLTIADGASLMIGSNTFPSGFTSHSIHANSTIEYDGGTQSIYSLNSSQDYGNLILSGTNGTKTMNGSIRVRGSLSFNGAATTYFSIGSNNTLTLEGQLYGSGITKALRGSSTSNLVLNGAYDRGLFMNTTLSSYKTINNLTVNNTSHVTTLGTVLEIQSNLNLNAGKLALNGNLLTVRGNMNNNVSEGITGGSGSAITMNNSSISNTLSLDQTTPGTTNLISTFIMNSSGQVTTLGNDAVFGALTFTNGKVAINGKTLTLKGAVTNTVTGGLRGSSTSNLIVNAAVSPTLSFDQSTPNTTNVLSNFTNNSSGQTITLGNALRLINVFTPTAGVFASAGNLTLASTNTGTARIAAGTSNYITGNVNIERYFPQKRSWRLITAPISGNATIYEAWQNSGSFESGKGMLVTAPIKGAGVDSLGNASLKRWDVGTQALQDITVTQTKVSEGSAGSADNTAYFAFVRGDRTITNIDFTNVNCNPTTFLATGAIQSGTQNYTGLSAAAGGFSLIGNPYASPIDMNLVLNNTGSTNLQRKIYVWDPKLNKVGGYVVLDDVLDPGVFSPTPYTSSQDNHLQSAQGFYVVTNSAGAATVEINESNKSTTNNTLLFGRPGGAASSIITNLSLVNADNTVEIADGTRADFSNNFSTAIDVMDHFKLTNTNETFGMVRSNKFLATERRPDIISSDTIFFRLNRTSQRKYRFDIQALNFDGMGLVAMLEDSYTGIPTPVSLTGTTTIDFVIDGNAASQINSRFRLVFSKTAPLPVTMSSIVAYQNKNDIKVDWKVDNEISVARYEVEKSINGTTYTTLQQVQAVGGGLYTITDVNPVNGDNYYRIRTVNQIGSTQVSRTVKVKFGKSESGMSVYPNPITDKVVNIQLNNQPKGNYQLRIFNTNGQVMMNTSIKHPGGSATQSFMLPATIKSGNCKLEVLDANGSKTIISLVIL
ncbi:MAG: T9SS type A sorting domain-containing protein [Ferruginibacter sp.]